MDFERILADLNDQITKIQITLQSTKQRQQQLQSLVSVIHAGIYTFIWIGYWIDKQFPYISPIRWIITSMNVYEPLIWTVLFLGFPLWSLLIYKIFTFYYQHKYKHYESLLELYKSKQKLELDALKKKTKYYQMRSLIQRYEGKDDTLEMDSSVDLNKIESQDQRHLTTPEKQIQDISPSIKQRDTKYSPSWMNRLVDTVLLDERNISSYTTSINNTSVLFALICSFCYSHNGFLNQKDYDILPCYICPKCGQMNIKNHSNEQEKLNEEIQKPQEKPKKQKPRSNSPNKQA